MTQREINRIKKRRREVLQAVSRYNPNPVTDKMVLDELDDDDVVVSKDELLKIFQYLKDLDLVELDFTRYGVETVYAVRIKAKGVDFVMGIGEEFQGIA